MKGWTGPTAQPCSSSARVISGVSANCHSIPRRGYLSRHRLLKAHIPSVPPRRTAPQSRNCQCRGCCFGGSGPGDERRAHPQAARLLLRAHLSRMRNQVLQDHPRWLPGPVLVLVCIDQLEIKQDQVGARAASVPASAWNINRRYPGRSGCPPVSAVSSRSNGKGWLQGGLAAGECHSAAGFFKICPVFHQPPPALRDGLPAQYFHRVGWACFTHSAHRSQDCGRSAGRRPPQRQAVLRANFTQV